MRLPLWRWASVLAPGALLFFLPIPGLSVPQRHLVAIFVATIVALVSQPVAMGVSVLVSMTLLALTGTLAPAKVLSGFANQTVWLIFTAFLFARAVIGSGFGMRVAYLLVRQLGRGPLSLAYAVAASNLVLAPFIPSDTARGGGVIYPITRSLARAFGSEPGETAARMGSFLMLAGFHSTYTASAMFLTGMAANPLIADFARSIGHVELTWVRWALAAALPGLLSLTVMPYMLYRLHTPAIRDTSPARALATVELESMGPLSRDERWLVLILLSVMAGWITSPLHGIPNAFVALAGVSAALLTGVLTWPELLAESKAWEALMWFAPMLMMSDALNESGVIKLISNAGFRHLEGWPWQAAAATLVLMYCFIHYGFASMTAQVTALYPAFLTAGGATGAPPLLIALALAFFSNLNAGLTHYGTGSAPVFFGAGYVSQPTWWRLGLLICTANLFFWLVIGPLWWKALGYW
ncbi:MAG TPA: DASS family sodium-coupled anion symporter [Bryobacteraceae bacterium]|nr:DASS family sodium-coupled anion symporter [Bryobacteraceae bacterium]